MLSRLFFCCVCVFFFFNDTATTEIYTLSLHDALPIPPRHLAAPWHRHSREDEYSYVLEGRLGAQLGDDVVYAEAGDLAFKPRERWHTFWNASDGPCRILEIISPAGFEHYFDELAAGAGSQEEYQARYGTQVDLDRTRRLCEQHGLVFPIND